MKDSLNTTLHITVGAAIQRDLDLSQELRLLKAALLYADKVKLCSLASSMLVTILPLGYLNEDKQLELIVYMSEALGEDPSSTVIALEYYRSIKQSRKKQRDKQALLSYLKLKSSIEKGFRDLRSKVEEIAMKAGADGLAQALDTGLVEFQLFDVNSENLVDEFFDSIKDTLLSGESYPLFDEFTGKLVKFAIDEGKLVPLGTSIAKATQVGLSSGLFNRLPLFDNASIEEIIDIRKELNGPLKRFRAAIVGFSKEIEIIPWNDEFKFVTEELYIEHVEPALLEIEEAIRSNKLLLALVARSLTYGVSASSTLGLMLSQLNQLPEILVALTAVAGTTVGAYEAVKKHRERKEEIERSQLYFYYKAGEMLAN